MLLEPIKLLLDFELDDANAFYWLHALWYLPTNFITFLGSRQRNLKKCRISAIYQPAEQNLLHVENIYKDTIDLRERSSRAQVPQVQPNYKIMKRMWNALFRRKIVFRFSLQQFETDDGCLFKRRNRVSNLTAQKKTSVQFESWLVSKIFEEISIF